MLSEVQFHRRTTLVVDYATAWAFDRTQLSRISALFLFLRPAPSYRPQTSGIVLFRCLVRSSQLCKPLVVVVDVAVLVACSASFNSVPRLRFVCACVGHFGCIRFAIRIANSTEPMSSPLPLPWRLIRHRTLPLRARRRERYALGLFYRPRASVSTATWDLFLFSFFFVAVC